MIRTLLFAACTAAAGVSALSLSAARSSSDLFSVSSAAPARKPVKKPQELPAVKLLRYSENARPERLPWPLDPEAVAEGKDTPRGEVRSYASAAEALIQGDTSLYLQPLEGKWKGEEFREGRLAGIRFTSRFKVPFAWVDRQLFLRLGGVGGPYEVKVNGKRIARTQDGYTPAEFDLTRHAKEGNNTLEIVAYAGGIGRMLENFGTPGTLHAPDRSYIVAQPRVRIRDIVADTRLEGGSGLLSLGVILKSHLLNFKEYNVYYELTAPDGRTVSSGHREARFDLRREDTVRFFANLPDILPWSHEAPNLYTLQLKTQYEGRFQEYVSFEIGFREVRMQEGRLLVNGREFPLRAVEYRAPADSAVLCRELAELKRKGANTIKVLHHPQPAALYRTCDRLGLYVCDQAGIDTHLAGNSRKKGGNPSNDPRWRDAYVERALAMYHTSKNHPSVILFSLADDSANGYNLYESYLALKRAESERPVIYNGAGNEWNSDAVTEPRKGDGRFVFAPASPENLIVGEPVSITAKDASRGIFTVTNRYDLTSLGAGDIRYAVRVGRKTVAAGELPVRLAPGESGEYTVPLPERLKSGARMEITLRVERDVPAAYRYVPSAQEPETRSGSLFRKPDDKELPAGTQRELVTEKTFSATSR